MVRTHSCCHSSFTLPSTRNKYSFSLQNREGKGASDFARIALQDFADVEMQRGQQQAFYVTLTDNRLVYAEGTDRHEMNISVQAENDEFTVFYGAAVRAYPLGLADPVTDFWYNAGFLGRLWYRRSDR